MEKETKRNVFEEILKGIESYAEEVYPTRCSKDFALKLKARRQGARERMVYHRFL